MGTQRAQVSEATIAAKNNVIYHPGMVEDDPAVRPPSWPRRRLEDLGVVENTMAPPAQRPSGFSINVTNATFIVLIIVTVAGGFWWTWERGQQSGIQIGEQNKEKEHLQQQLKSLEEEINILKDTQGIPRKEKNK